MKNQKMENQKMENQKQLVLKLINEIEKDIDKQENLLAFLTICPNDYDDLHSLFDIEITAREKIKELKEKLSHFYQVLKLYNDLEKINKEEK